ncbi:MAG: hypothetical protein WC645_07955 [Candidatus Margulisiibacteriota bacterium]
MLKPEEVRKKWEKIQEAKNAADEKKNAALDRARQIQNDAIVERETAMRAADALEKALQDECPHTGRAPGQTVCPDCRQGQRR